MCFPYLIRNQVSTFVDWLCNVTSQTFDELHTQNTSLNSRNSFIEVGRIFVCLNVSNVRHRRSVKVQNSAPTNGLWLTGPSFPSRYTNPTSKHYCSLTSTIGQLTRKSVNLSFNLKLTTSTYLFSIFVHYSGEHDLRFRNNSSCSSSLRKNHSMEWK